MIRSVIVAGVIGVGALLPAPMTEAVTPGHPDRLFPSPPRARLASQIKVTERCIVQLQGYRTAIRFLVKQQKQSPKSLTIDTKTGDSITVINRTRLTRQSHVRVLEDGMAAKAQACLIALAQQGPVSVP